MHILVDLIVDQIAKSAPRATFVIKTVKRKLHFFIISKCLYAGQLNLTSKYSVSSLGHVGSAGVVFVAYFALRETHSCNSLKKKALVLVLWDAGRKLLVSFCYSCSIKRHFR